MRPRLFEIPIPFLNLTLPVNAYGTMMVIGFLLGVYLANRRARRMGLDANVMTDVGMVAIISGILGARLFYVVQFHEEFAGRWLEVLRVDKGGLVFFGGFFAAVACVAVYCRRKHLSILNILDIASPSVAVGLAFTRIGCFLNGCCWGRACSAALPWAVRFPQGSGAFEQQAQSGLLTHSAQYSLAVHPTQLYESLAAIGLFFLTSWLFKYRKRRGEILASFFVSYGIARFFIEFLRADNERMTDALTMSQNISILAVVVGVVWIIWGRLRTAE